LISSDGLKFSSNALKIASDATLIWSDPPESRSFRKKVEFASR